MSLREEIEEYLRNNSNESSYTQSWEIMEMVRMSLNKFMQKEI